MNTTARAARVAALERHRKEVRKWKTLAAIFFFGWVLTSGWHIGHPPPQPATWRTDQAPALQPFYVVTRAYVDKKGNWRSYTNGEQIEITHWTTHQP
jgi:hypothetical protein